MSPKLERIRTSFHGNLKIIIHSYYVPKNDVKSRPIPYIPKMGSEVLEKISLTKKKIF